VLILYCIFNKRQNEDQNVLLNMVPLLDIIPLSILNESYYSKNRSASSAAMIIIIIAKYPENFVYLLMITRIASATSPVFILVGGKPVIKSIINSDMGFYGIGSTNNLLYR
jgi:hypothetical protein